MKCRDGLGTFGIIKLINKKVIVTYHVDKKLDKSIEIKKDRINLNKKIKKAKPFFQNMLGIRRFGL
jgi:hypothetical protein